MKKNNLKNTWNISIESFFTIVKHGIGVLIVESCSTDDFLSTGSLKICNILALMTFLGFQYAKLLFSVGTAEKLY